MPNEYQPSNSVFQNYVLPQETASVTLSGGRVVPYAFYLGSNNTIPFLRFESPITQKELSWGDLIELQPGQNVNVRNVSYMPGDLQIQSGRTPVPPPGRITIPVDCDLEHNETALVITPKYPCDTRRARRAYFCLSVQIPTITAMLLSVSGHYRQHTKNPQTFTKEAYVDTYEFTTMFPEIIPLGTSFEGNAMRLVDLAKVAVNITAGDTSDPAAFVDAFYILEY